MGNGKRARLSSVFIIGLAIALSPGCTGPDETQRDGPFGMIASLGLGGRAGQSEDEANDSFVSPAALRVAPGDVQTLDGAIDSTSDVDVYDVGPVMAGQQIVVDVTSRRWLDAAAAVFDADENLLYVNDDRNYFAGVTDPYINFVIHRDSARCYVVVTSSPGGSSTGEYRLSITLSSPGEPPAPHPQTVVLNFDGASHVTFGGRPAVDIDAFDAAGLSATLDGRTNELIDLVADKVREDYRGLNVTFFTSLDADAPTEDVTTIHFGAFDPALLGVAANVDEFNAQAVQEAIVFTDTFEVFNALSPTLEEYAQALANVASHETGHLLGLVHTADARAIMDITASLRQLTRNQAFASSPIESSTFSIGYQDSATTLVDSVGGDLRMVRAATDEQLDVREAARIAIEMADMPIDRTTLSRCFCGACEAKRHKETHRAH